jgi:hydroxyacyl-ACP dehydratase HTD2-like protein with hotdog domain
VPINLDAVGAIRIATNVITPRWALAYSSSLGLSDATYLDDSRPADMTVPPTFCVCLEWTISDIEARASLLGLAPHERRRGVHALQDSRFYRPLRLGMRVRTTSKLEYIRRTGAGAYTLTRFEHVDEDTGEALITSFSGGILRGIDLAKPSVGEMPSDFVEASAASDLDVRLPELALERTLPHVYSECARIWNPIHTERAVALEAGLEDIIVHGTITWALAAREICRSVGAANLGELKRLTARFRAPIVAGRPMTISYAGKRNGKVVDFAAVNERGETMLANGLIELD